ncbi:MAG TPA: FCD domain-containing protein [Candidatus Dormibacteraeota bacterium]|nr:FCD domain-containing protein [Candidatus Dormibacteraeota bacterium]
MATPSRKRLGEQVAELLLAAIRLHEFLPGEKLPSERELCTRLGVNRTAVREGLRWLEHQRFIEIRRGKYGGAFVLHAPADLAVARIRDKIADLRQLLEFRAVIEPRAAGMAAERIEDVELQRLRELHAREQEELGLTRAQLRAIDVEIHEIIASASKNQYILRAVQDIRLRLAPALDVIGRSLTRRRESQTGHAELLEALGRHDVPSAVAAMERHVAATRRAIATALAEKGIELDRVRSSPASVPASAEEGTPARLADEVG